MNRNRNNPVRRPVNRLNENNAHDAGEDENNNHPNDVPQNHGGNANRVGLFGNLNRRELNIDFYPRAGGGLFGRFGGNDVNNERLLGENEQNRTVQRKKYHFNLRTITRPLISKKENVINPDS